MRIKQKITNHLFIREGLWDAGMPGPMDASLSVFRRDLQVSRTPGPVVRGLPLPSVSLPGGPLHSEVRLAGAERCTLYSSSSTEPLTTSSHIC